jgi:hypothetical protein
MGATRGNLKTAREMHPEKIKTPILAVEKAEFIHGFRPALLLPRR